MMHSYHWYSLRLRHRQREKLMWKKILQVFSDKISFDLPHMSRPSWNVSIVYFPSPGFIIWNFTHDAYILSSCRCPVGSLSNSLHFWSRNYRGSRPRFKRRSKQITLSLINVIFSPSTWLLRTSTSYGRSPKSSAYSARWRGGLSDYGDLQILVQQKAGISGKPEDFFSSRSVPENIS